MPEIVLFFTSSMKIWRKDNVDMSRIPRIVILGAGYGGIVTAIRLQKELHYNEADVTLVNKHDYHYFTTNLHMPAAGTEDPDHARVNILKLIDEFKIDFVKSTVQQIRLQEHKVSLEDGVITYDYLIIALGGEPETFGIPGLKENAMSIRSINSVNLIREHIEYQFAKYKRGPEQEKSKYLTFVVGGAGFTGIEFVGELAERMPSLCKKFDVDPSLVQIINIEAAPTVLPGFEPGLVEYAMKALSQKGVTFKIGTAIKECTPDAVILEGGEEIATSTIVWTGGIRGNRMIDEAGFEAKRGRVKVDPYLRAPDRENVFILGDCSLVLDAANGRPYPPTAQIAIQQAESCAHNLIAAIRGESMKEFTPTLKGTVASLGKRDAIGLVGSQQMTGFMASVMKKLIDLRYLYTIGGIPLILRKGRL